MSKSIKLYKPCGMAIDVSPASYQYAVEVLGWSKTKPKAEKAAPKKKAAKKEA